MFFNKNINKYLLYYYKLLNLINQYKLESLLKIKN